MSNPYQKNTRVLVTGGCGFIGTNYIRSRFNLFNDECIINLDKLTYAACNQDLVTSKEHPAYHFIEGDICDAYLVKEILKKHDINCIIHFAAESHVDRSITSPEKFITTNIIGTYTLLDAAKEYWLIEKKLAATECRFHQISTDEVYGSLEPGAAAFTENNRYNPSSPYSASKAAADHLVTAYHRTYGLSVTTSYCTNNYGPYQHREKFIPTIIHACLHKDPIHIYGDGQQTRDWLYVEDHCLALHSIIHEGVVGEGYNIAGNNEWGNLALTEMICSLMDEMFPANEPYKQLIQFVEDRAGHDRRYALDISRTKQQFKWQPTTHFSEGLKKTIQYYLNLWKPESR